MSNKTKDSDRRSVKPDKSTGNSDWTAKEYLLQTKYIRTRLATMSEQLEHLKSAAEYAYPQYSDMPMSPTRNAHKNEDAIIRVMEMEQHIAEEFGKLTAINKTIEKIQDSLGQAIMVKRYLGNKTWETIASELYISVRHVQRLHDSTLREVEDILKVGMVCH